MAFEADCDVSTVLEAICVTSTAGSLVQGAARRLVARAPFPSRPGAGNSLQLTRLPPRAGKFEIRNSKFEIRAGIPNS